MEFGNDAQRELYGRVKEWMAEWVAGTLPTHPELPWFGPVGEGSARVWVQVVAGGADAAFVRVLSWIVHDIEPSKELFEYLLHENQESSVGAFGFFDNSVSLSHSYFGDTVQKDELGRMFGLIA